MDKVSIIPFKGTDIHILYKKGQLGYSFEFKKPDDKEPKAYGQKVTLQGRATADIVSAAFLLFVSASDTIDALQEQIESEALANKSK